MSYCKLYRTMANIKHETARPTATINFRSAAPLVNLPLNRRQEDQHREA